MKYVRVYNPVTNEPFDVPEAKATELRLEKGWLSHPIDPEAVSYVTSEEIEEIDEGDYSDEQDQDSR